jgi:hypothetical protein
VTRMSLGRAVQRSKLRSSVGFRCVDAVGTVARCDVADGKSRTSVGKANK